MTINTAMFQKIYDQITQHPETHDQGVFESTTYCGTQRCVAGWAIAFEYGVDENGSIYDYDAAVGRYVNDGSKGGDYRYLSETAVKAAEILGLTDGDAYKLFYGTDDGQAVAECLRYATAAEQ